MKQILVMMAAVLLAGCGTTKVDPNDSTKISYSIVEKAVRESLKKPTGQLTEADLAKVTLLILEGALINDAQLVDVAKLPNLKILTLQRSKITGEGLKELSKMQNLQGNLEILDLSYTKITDEDLKHVSWFGFLRILRIHGTKMRGWGEADLKKEISELIVVGP